MLVEELRVDVRSGEAIGGCGEMPARDLYSWQEAIYTELNQVVVMAENGVFR